MDEYMEGWNYYRKEGYLDGKKKELIWFDRQIRRIEGQMDGWMDGWIGWIDRQMAGRKSQGIKQPEIEDVSVCGVCWES